MDTWVWSVLMLLVALIIVAIELFVPSGGLLGVLSAMAVCASLVLAFMTSIKFGMIMLTVSCFLIPIVIMSGLHWWPHTPIGRRILIRPPTRDEVVPDLEEERHLRSLIGKRGVAKSKMLPSGIVEIEGQTYDANSDGAAIDPEQPIEVIGETMRRLQVRLVSTTATRPAPKPVNNSDDILSRPIESLGLEELDDPLA